MAGRPVLPGVRDGTGLAAEHRMIGVDSPAATGTTDARPDRWRVKPLSIVAQGDGFLVGDAGTRVFVLLPPIGVEVIGWLRAGHGIDEVARLAREYAGEDVDVMAFVESVRDLGFVEAVADDAELATVTATSPTAVIPAALDWLARVCFNRVAWLGYALAAVGSAVVLCGRPDLFPRVDDLFFLSTPARSIAALTVLTYVLATLHECAHWLAARAVGVPARIRISRRLYFLAFETDLTGLWSLPRRRRFGPILAGMALDAAILMAILGARLAGVDQDLLPALTFLQIAAIASQFFVFARTDIYALLVTATGTVNLYRTTQLSLLAATGLARARHTEELAGAPDRDRRVARWYRWVWLAGMALAGWFFVAFFIPTTVRTFTWVGVTVWAADPARGAFWEALALGVVLLSPRILTAKVAVRDLSRVVAGAVRRRRRPSSVQR